MLKTNRIIKTERNYIGKIIYKENDEFIDLIEKKILSSFKYLNSLYKINNLKTTIELIYSRKEFNDKIGHQTPEWMIGYSFKNNIYLFSPLVLEKVSTHKNSGLNKIIIHELCHSFNEK